MKITGENPLIRKFAVSAFLLVVLASAAWPAGVAERITYQGNLRESGVLVTGTKSMRFRLYDDPSAGNLLWDSGAADVAVSTGVFRVVLAPSGLDWEAAGLWLELEVEGVALSPREELTAAPYAIDALLHSGKRYTSAAAAPASPAAGDLWYDTGAGALRFFNGASWVAPSGGISSVAADAAQFSGDGTAGDPLALRSSSVTLQGNEFNAADRLVKLDGSGALPAVDGSVVGNLNASNLATGTVPDGRLAASVARVGTANTWTAVQTLSDVALNLTGPNGNLVGQSSVTASAFFGDGSGLTGVSDPSKVAKAGDAMTGDLQLGGAAASTYSAAGFFTLANLFGAPAASRGRLYFDASGQGALRISLDGTSFVPLSTGAAGGGLSSVAADAAQFVGDGTAGDPLRLLASSVTLQGNQFNVAGALVLLDAGGKLPPLDGSALTGVTAGPGGADAQVQFNDAGVLSGDAGLTYDKAQGRLRVGGSEAAVELAGPQRTAVFVSTAGVVEMKLDGATMFRLK